MVISLEKLQAKDKKVKALFDKADKPHRKKNLGKQHKRLLRRMTKIKKKAAAKAAANAPKESADKA